MQFSVSSDCLTSDEKQVFMGCLQRLNIDTAVWDIYDSFLQSKSSFSKPYILRAFDGQKLAGVIYFIVCYGTGKSLFKNPLLSSMTNIMKIPVYVWVRQGICADILSNPGFVSDGFDYQQTISNILQYLRKVSPCLTVTDSAENAPLYRGTKTFPYPKDGIITLEGMRTIEDYLDSHSNLKRKVRKFVKDGGSIEIHKGAFDRETIVVIEKCILATMSKSVIYTPFQDHFPTMILQTCYLNSNQIVNFVARMNNQFLGYHTFIQTGTGLRLVHGAFDRTLDTTQHSYENIITAAAEYAINNGLKAVYYGPVMNETKNRLMNLTIPTNVYLTCNILLYKLLIPFLYGRSSMQAKEFVKFS
jgi:hypothetical protein